MLEIILPMRNNLSKHLYSIFLLNLIGLFSVLVLFVIEYVTKSGSGSYLQEISDNIGSLGQVIFYVLYLLAYSITNELITKRLILENLLNRFKRNGLALGILLATGLYVLVHARYGTTAGIGYAATLNLGLCLMYTKIRDWRLFALWHVQWNLVVFLLGVFYLYTQ